jgi:hypothetical protein
VADAMRLAVGALYKRKFASVTKIPRPSRTLTSIIPAGRVRRPWNVLQYLPRHAWQLGNVGSDRPRLVEREREQPATQCVISGRVRIGTAPKQLSRQGTGNGSRIPGG